MTNGDKSVIHASTAGNRFTRREGGCPIKYQLWYFGLIEAAQRRETPAQYTEVHHILPRSLGGSDLPSNLVRVTYREHFLGHWLLTKMHDGEALHKMRLAFYAMSLRISGQRVIGSWQFEAVKRALTDLKLGHKQEKSGSVRSPKGAQEISRA